MATKSPSSSKTVWFGIAFLIIGLALAIVSFLMEQPMFDAAILSTISGILTIFLRFKTQVAIAFGIDDPSTPEDESTMKDAPKNSGFARIAVLVLTALVSLMFIAGCGSVFTVTKGELVTLDIKPTAPSYAVVSIAGAETCKVSNPEGTITLLNVCTEPMVSTMTPAGEPTCVPNPCAMGLDFVFLPNGMTTCK